MSLASLSDDLARSVAGDPWHGPSLGTLLDDLTETEAASHPIPGAHSIAELVLHVAAWMDEVARRLAGGEPAAPEAGDWPAVGTWPEARGRLAAAHERLQQALAAFPEARLGERLGSERDAPLGTGVTFAAMVGGVVAHNAYHGGQIALLRRVPQRAS